MIYYQLPKAGITSTKTSHKKYVSITRADRIIVNEKKLLAAALLAIVLVGITFTVRKKRSKKRVFTANNLVM